ncbi:hypothetical protein Tco_1516557 [Tanacetum coccineum]
MDSKNESHPTGYYYRMPPPLSKFYLCHILFQPPSAATYCRRRKRGRHLESPPETRLLSETAAIISTVANLCLRGKDDVIDQEGNPKGTRV